MTEHRTVDAFADAARSVGVTVHDSPDDRYDFLIRAGATCLVTKRPTALPEGRYVDLDTIDLVADLLSAGLAR